MNNNYLKYNNLGILVDSSLGEVSQGNHNVDVYYIAYDVYDYTNSYATIAYTLPDGTNLPDLATGFKDFEFNGSNYKGFTFRLPRELTSTAGNLTITINLYSNENDTRLCSSRVNINIHATNYSNKITITDLQYTQLLDVIQQNYNELRNMIEELKNK